MKKSFLLFLILTAVAIISFVPVAYADGNITPRFSLINSTDYIEFSPQKLSVNDDYIVYTENDSLYALSRKDNSKLNLNITGYSGIESIAVYKTLMFCILRDDNKPLMRIYDLTTGNHTDSSIVGLSLIVGVSLAVYNDSLFICYRTGYYVYDLSAIETLETINGKLASSQNIQESFDSSELFAANSQSVFAVRKDNSVTDIRLSGEKYSFTLPFYPTAVSADDNYLYLLTETEIHVYTLTDYTEVCSVSSDESLGTSSQFISLSSYNSKLYASFSSLANGVAVYDMQNDGTLLREKLLTTVGATLERLNNPVSISADGETVAIADKGNDRVLIPNSSEIKSTGVYKVAVNSTDVYFADSEGLKLYPLPNDSATTLISNVTVNSLKSFKDGVLYIDNNGDVYTYSNSSSSLIAGGNFIDVCASFNGKILYLVNNENIVALHTDAKTTLFTTQLSSVHISGQVMRIECDACGNLIIMTENDNAYKLTYLKRLLSGYEYVDCVTVDGITPTDFTLSDDGIYFTSNNPHTLTYISFEELNAHGIEYKATFTSAYTAPDCKSSEPILKEAKIYKITNGNYNSFTYPDDYESGANTEIDALVYCIDNKEYEHNGNTFCYVMRNGAGEFILKSSITELSSSIPSVKYGSTLFANTVVYKYPDVNSVKLTMLNKGAQIETLSDVCGYDNSAWYSIYVDGGVGYVKRADIVASKRGSDSQANDPITPEKYYADVCSDNTKIYTEANESSSIIGILKVGDTVELSAPYDKDELFTFVTFGEISGYVLTSSLKTPGLSTAQIVALVIIFSAAFIIIFLRILSKKTARKKN